MLIATWNVNSVKARLDTVTAWLKEASPDVVCFQELKCEDMATGKSCFCYGFGIHRLSNPAPLAHTPLCPVLGLPSDPAAARA